MTSHRPNVQTVKFGILENNGFRQNLPTVVRNNSVKLAEIDRVNIIQYT